MNLNELKKIEIQGENTSNKYVFLKSSDIVKALSPQFEFIEATQWNMKYSLHTVSLKMTNPLDGTTERIVFENSFNGSAAFRMRLDSNVFVPLNLERKIHIGKQASTLIEDFKHSKAEIINSINDAKNYVMYLKNTNIPKFIQTELEDLLFKKIKENDNFIELDILEPTHNAVNFHDYILDLVHVFVNGHYNVAIQGKTKEKIRKGKKVGDNFESMRMQQKIFKYLKKSHPELEI